MDVLLHPKVYLMKNDNFDIPNFDKTDVNKGDSKKALLLPSEE